MNQISIKKRQYIRIHPSPNPIQIARMSPKVSLGKMAHTTLFQFHAELEAGDGYMRPFGSTALDLQPAQMLQFCHMGFQQNGWKIRFPLTNDIIMYDHAVPDIRCWHVSMERRIVVAYSDIYLCADIGLITPIMLKIPEMITKTQLF